MKKLLETMVSLKDNRNGKVVTFDFDHTIVKSFLNKTVVYFSEPSRRKVVQVSGFSRVCTWCLCEVGRQPIMKLH